MLKTSRGTKITRQRKRQRQGETQIKKSSVVVSKKRKPQQQGEGDVFAILPIELIHRIQSLLPFQESARACILSRSLLHAWSTIDIPTLRFPLLIKPIPVHEIEELAEHELEKGEEVDVGRQIKYHKFIDTTLLRYHRDNIPIQSFDLQFKVNNDDYASLSEKWIRQVASSSYSSSNTNTCLKDLSLIIWVLTPSFILPNEIFSCQNLETIYIRAPEIDSDIPLCINPPPQMIKCVSLRVLEFREVNITEHVIDSFLSTCTLLEKFVLDCCDGYKTIKVKNLPFLRQLVILSIEKDDVLEMTNLPSLTFFQYTAVSHIYKRSLPFNMDSLRTVTDLVICGVIMDIDFFDMIKSKLPFLKSLFIGIGSWVQPGEKLVITSRTINTLTIQMWVRTFINVQVYAPNLLSCECECGNATPPSVSFANVAPDQVKVTIT